MKKQEKVLSSKDISERLGVTKVQAWRLFHRKERPIPHETFSRRAYAKECDFTRWLAAERKFLGGRVDRRYKIIGKQEK